MRPPSPPALFASALPRRTSSLEREAADVFRAISFDWTDAPAPPGMGVVPETQGMEPHAVVEQTCMPAAQAQLDRLLSHPPKNGAADGTRGTQQQGGQGDEMLERMLSHLTRTAPQPQPQPQPRMWPEAPAGLLAGTKRAAAAVSPHDAKPVAFPRIAAAGASELEKVQKELRALKLKLTFVTRANKELEATVGRLHAENAELRSELKAARGAVAEASSLPPPPWA